MSPSLPVAGRAKRHTRGLAGDQNSRHILFTRSRRALNQRSVLIEPGDISDSATRRRRSPALQKYIVISTGTSAVEIVPLGRDARRD